MSQWDFIKGKRLRLCHYYAVTQIQSTGKYKDLEQPVIFREFLKRKLTDNEVYFPFIKGLSIHGNLITHTRAYVTCCIHNIGHNNGIHTRVRTHTHFGMMMAYVFGIY